jgi:hypothetical protein
VRGRRVATIAEFYKGQPGDYLKVTHAQDGRVVWWVRDPAGRTGRLTDHTVTEHDDGTVTVYPSVMDPSPGGWHGWLVEGEWRSV